MSFLSSQDYDEAKCWLCRVQHWKNRRIVMLQTYQLCGHCTKWFDKICAKKVLTKKKG